MTPARDNPKLPNKRLVRQRSAWWYTRTLAEAEHGRRRDARNGLFDRIKKAFSAPRPPPVEEGASDSAKSAEDDGIGVPDEAIPTAPQLIRKITGLKVRPSAFQALWDGDTQGWGLCLQVVHRAGAKHTSTLLVFLRFGGDIRLFNGQVPPWPEAAVGAELGEALARHYGVPFFFPSPREPDDGCPNWWEQDKAIHCEDCDKLIIPTDSPHLPKEVCYPCHIKREADEKVRKDEPSSPDGVTNPARKGRRLRASELCIERRGRVHRRLRNARARAGCRGP